MESAKALKRAELEPAQLEAKEGLALLNGTQAMHAVGGLSIFRAKRISRVADVAGAMTLEALQRYARRIRSAIARGATASRAEGGRSAFAFAFGEKRNS